MARTSAQLVLPFSMMLLCGILSLPLSPAIYSEEQPALRISQKDWAHSRFYRIDSNASPEHIRHLGKTLDTVFRNFQKRFGKVNPRRLPLTVRFLKPQKRSCTPLTALLLPSIAGYASASDALLLGHICAFGHNKGYLAFPYDNSPNGQGYLILISKVL